MTTKSYEELGYCVPIKAHIAIDHTLPAFGQDTPNKRVFMDQLPKKPFQDPPDWVLKRLAHLKSSLEKYR